MDKKNDKWLDSHLDSQPQGEDAQLQKTEKLPSSDDLELERIIQETIEENWGADFKPESTDSDAEITQFFAPHTGNNPIQAEAVEEGPVAPEPDDDFFQGIFDAVAQDSDQLVGENAKIIEEEEEETDDLDPETRAMIREILTDDANSDSQDSNERYSDDEEAFDPDTPAKKTRPRKKEGYGLFGIPHIFSTVVWAALILFIGITVGRTVWLCAVDLLALGKTPKEVTITITEEDTITQIAKKLETTGLIRYPSLFELFANLTKKSEDILPGTVTFDGKIVYDYNALISAMSYKESTADVVEVTIPEGFTCKQIYALLEEQGVCSVADLEEYASGGELKEYWFLEGVKRDSKYCLEGFLFPDTYEFYKDAEPRQVFEKLLDTFDLRFTDRLKAKYESLKADLRMDLSLYEVMIMATIVQKEKANELEGYTIASVYYNRLKDAETFSYNSLFKHLDCDATVLYGTEVLGITTGDNPYDTSIIEGLPPTPICNPGLSSIDAALEPDSDSLETSWATYKESDNTGYYFFVLDTANNVHRFAVTYAEHDKNLKELGYYDED